MILDQAFWPCRRLWSAGGGHGTMRVGRIILAAAVGSGVTLPPAAGHPPSVGAVARRATNDCHRVQLDEFRAWKTDRRRMISQDLGIFGFHAKVNGRSHGRGRPQAECAAADSENGQCQRPPLSIFAGEAEWAEAGLRCPRPRRSCSLAAARTTEILCDMACRTANIRQAQRWQRQGGQSC
jgi:hypothetical protein